MTDTTRDAFEAWFLAYRKGTWLPLSSDPRKEMPKHWNINCEMDCWRGWQAATEQGKRQPQWLPIETAPKDAYVLLWIDIVIGHPLVVQGCWFYDDDGEVVEKGWIDLNGDVLYATHWQPLPLPPTATPQGNQS